MDVRMIVNPVAGRGRGRAMAERLEDGLKRRGVGVEVVYTAARGDAEVAAAAPGADAILSVGGDGTANECLNGMAGTSAVFGVVSAGTANVVARQIRVGRDLEAYADLVQQERSIPLDVGLWNGRRFIMGAGAGLDAAIVTAVQSKRQGPSSLWHWVLPTITTILNYPSPKIRVVVDGQVLSELADYAIVGNCIYSAGIFPATPRARIDDGLLDVVVVEGVSAWRMARLALGVWRPGFLEWPFIRYAQGKNIEFIPNEEGSAIPLQVDGDMAGAAPVSFGIVPHGVRIFSPMSM